MCEAAGFTWWDHGGYCHSVTGEVNSKTFDTAVSHTSAQLTTSLIFGGSRDSEQDSLWIDGEQVVTLTASMHDGDICTQESTGASLESGFSDDANYQLHAIYEPLYGEGCSVLNEMDWMDWSYDPPACNVTLVLTMPHSDDTLTVGYSSGIDESLDNEMFAFGGLEIQLLDDDGTTLGEIVDQPGSDEWTDSTADVDCGIHGPFGTDGYYGYYSESDCSAAGGTWDSHGGDCGCDGCDAGYGDENIVDQGTCEGLTCSWSGPSSCNCGETECSAAGFTWWDYDGYCNCDISGSTDDGDDDNDDGSSDNDDSHNDDGPSDSVVESIGDATISYWSVTKKLFKDLWSAVF